MPDTGGKGESRMSTAGFKKKLHHKEGTAKRTREAKQQEAVFSQNRLTLLVERWYWVLAVLFFAICIFFSFYQLGVHPARDWDEARHGVSAYEMLKSKSYLMNTYQYQPDYYNLKPPLSFWGVMLGYRLFGFTLFGMRFYSALSFVLTVAAIGLFCQKRYGRIEALSVLLTLACCAPFYHFHFARHADADALFSLFTVLSLLSMLLIEEHRWAFPACSGAFALAFLTKSWHALFVPPIVFLFLLARRLFFRLDRKQWLAFIAAGALPILLWVLLRYQQDGVRFFSDMIRYDLLNRTTQVLEGHYGGPAYYWRLLFSLSPLSGWFPVAMGMIYAGFRLCEREELPDNPTLMRDLPYLLLWLGLPLLLFSLAKTKLAWYLFPLDFPAIMLGGLLLAQILRGAKRQWLWRGTGAITAAAIIVASFTQTWEQIKSFSSDPLQDLMQSRQESLSHTAGDTAYLVIDPNKTFGGGTQKYVLMGELCFDWNVRLETLDAFFSDPSAGLLVTDDFNQPTDPGMLKDCRLLVKEGDYSIYEKI